MDEVRIQCTKCKRQVPVEQYVIRNYCRQCVVRPLDPDRKAKHRRWVEARNHARWQFDNKCSQCGEDLYRDTYNGRWKLIPATEEGERRERDMTAIERYNCDDLPDHFVILCGYDYQEWCYRMETG